VHSRAAGQRLPRQLTQRAEDVEIFEEVPEAKNPEAKNEDTLL